MPRGRKRKFKFNVNVRTETLRSILSLVLLLLALLSLISFFAPDYFINEKLQQILRGLFGFPSILMVFVLAIAGLVLIDTVEFKLKEPRILISLVILMLCLSSLFHSFTPAEEGFSYASSGNGGGIVGFFISRALINTVSIYGAVAIVVIGFVISVILLFNTSLDQIIGFFQVLTKGGLNIPLLKRKSSDEEDGGEIEVSEGVGMDTEATPVEDDSQDEDENAEIESSIEVLDRKYEPDMAYGQEEIGQTIAKVTPKLPYADKVWKLPPLDLLDTPKKEKIDTAAIDEERKKIIKQTLKSFGIDVEVVSHNNGPSVTQYILKTDSGVRVSKITGLQNNLALALRSPTGLVRVEAPIPGTSHIGIEVPNEKVSIVNFKSMITSEPIKGMRSKIGVILGIDVGGTISVYDIKDMPHLLIAGATGSGKSVFIHNMIFSILYRATPQEVKLVLVDPKRVELQLYDGMPHLLSPVITELDKAVSVLKWAVAEMERRLNLFSSAKVRNIDEYNDKSGFQAMEYILIIVDELAQIIKQDPNGVEKNIVRLAQLSRAAGMHLILAVQRPSAEVVTGQIKANIPCRVAFSVPSLVDSRVIIDQPGAEKLLGKGDMLFVPPDGYRPKRLQGAFLDRHEIERVIGYLKEQGVEPDYKDDVVDMLEKGSSGKASEYVSSVEGDVDDKFDEAVEVVVEAGKASTSLLQRRLSVGYARAARIMDELEENGIVDAQEGNRPRNVLLDSLPGDELQEFKRDIPDISEDDDSVESIQSL